MNMDSDTHKKRSKSSKSIQSSRSNKSIKSDRSKKNERKSMKNIPPKIKIIRKASSRHNISAKILARCDEQNILNCLEKEYEVMKINLSLREDFNLIDAFAILDVRAKSALTRAELRNALVDLKVYLKEEDIDLIFHQFSSDGDVISYRDFSDAFLPNDQHYLKKLIAKRLTYSQKECTRIFSDQTTKMFAAMWEHVGKLAAHWIVS